MRILISNDDGFEATGIKHLYEIARTITDDVWVCAPDTNYSGVSRALLSHEVSQLRMIDRQRYHISAPPAFCVSYAIEKLMADKKPDLVLSGVNKGSNLGVDIGYSGTVGAALEATAHGVPAIALSQALPEKRGYEDYNGCTWDNTLHYAREVILNLYVNKMPANTLACVDFPSCHYKKVAGVLVTHQCIVPIKNRIFHDRTDEYNRKILFIGSRKRDYQNNEGIPNYDRSDLWASCNNYISIVPVKAEWSDESQFASLRKQFSGLDQQLKTQAAGRRRNKAIKEIVKSIA